MLTETIIRTLKEAKQENPKHILPRTVLKAIADENGDFISSDVTAQDINQLHGKTFVTANAQTLTDAQKAQARANINAAAPDGYYGNSGGVMQYSTNFLGKNTPQNASNVVFRPTASQMSGQSWSADSISWQTATVEKIKGKTLVFNQLCQNGNFASTSGWNFAGINPTVSNNILTLVPFDNQLRAHHAYIDVALTANHKYLISFRAKRNINNENAFTYNLGGTIKRVSLGTSYTEISTITDSVISYNYFYFYPWDSVQTTVEVEENVSIKNLIIIDLTQMFGAGNEPATVEEFRAMFPLDYYEYNPGELISFNGTGLQTTGFNQLKPDGTINVIGGMTYRIEGAYTSLVDSAGNAVTVTDNEFTPAQDDTYTMVGGSCVHLKWSGVRDGDTEDYWQRQLALPIATYFPEGMKSAGTAYDELTKDKAVKRIGKVDLGTLAWAYAGGLFRADITDMKVNSVLSSESNLKCSYFTTIYKNYITEDSARPDKAICTWYSLNRVIVKDSAYTDATAFKTAMSGVMLYYELAEPVETPISPELNLTYKVDDFGTEMLLPQNTDEPVTTPMDADIVYQLDYEAQVRNNDRINISKASMDNFIASFNASGLGTITQTYNPNTKQYEYTVTAPQSEPTEGGETV